MIVLALAAWAAANLIAFLLFGLDKAAARRGGRRIPETTLLWSAALGGGWGAALGQGLLRHKTRKQPFARRLTAIVAVQAVFCLIGLWAVFGRA